MEIKDYFSLLFGEGGRIEMIGWKKKKVSEVNGLCEVVYGKTAADGEKESITLKGRDLNECTMAFGRMLGTLLQAAVHEFKAHQSQIAGEDQVVEASGPVGKPEDISNEDYQRLYG